jgi:DNA-binding beta-propeller fold protein YncE
MNSASERRHDPRFAVVLALIGLAFAAFLAFAARAQASETIYWDNYSTEPATIGATAIDGSASALLNLTGATLESPEGMAYDPVTNRIYVGSSHPESSDLGEIFYVNLDGSGAGVLATPGVAVEEPEGVAIDPVTRLIYWVNTQGNGTADGSINWAKLDGSGGGMLNTTGATLDSPYKIALDTVHGKVYWANTGTALDVISFANANNTGGGGDLDLTGATPPEGITGFSVDPAGSRLYWLENTEEKVSFASLAGGGGGDVDLSGAVFNDPYGLAFDPTKATLYWGNYGSGKGENTNAIGFVSITGGGGAISPAPTALAKGPQDPVVIKLPSGAGLPTLTRSTKSRSQLSCSTGSWGGDFPGSFVYQSPRAFAYQWTRNGKPVAGAVAATFNAKSAGKYACVVTATNQAGSASQTSAAINVKGAKIKLSTKKKAKGEPGDLLTFKVKAVNQGDLKPKNAKVCVKLPKAAKADLKAPKCKKLGQLKGRAKKTLKLKIKVKAGAEGTDKVTFQVKGASGKSAKSKVIIG